MIAFTGSLYGHYIMQVTDKHVLFYKNLNFRCMGEKDVGH